MFKNKKKKKERAIDKLPKNLIRKKKLMAEVKPKKTSFIDMGKLLIRTTPENLNVFFPSENLGFGR